VFTQATGINISIKYGATAQLLEKIRAGRRADMLLAVGGSIDDLIGENILKPGTRVDLVSSDVAMAVALSSPVPDISTQEAFVSTLRAARSIAFSKQGASGMYFASLIKRLGLDEEVRAKAIVLAEGLTGELVAKGEVEIAVQQMSELMQVPGINILPNFRLPCSNPPSFRRVFLMKARNSMPCRLSLRSCRPLTPSAPLHNKDWIQYERRLAFPDDRRGRTADQSQKTLACGVRRPSQYQD